MRTEHRKKTEALMLMLVVAMMVCSLSFYLSYALPYGATISSSSTDSGPTIAPDSSTDDGGEIVTLVLDLEQQTNNWKAYVGNVTGKFILQNSNNYSIYEWPSGDTIEGEVYISRNESVNFTSGAITCADNTEMNAENTFLGISGSAIYSVNGTFNSTNHSAFDVGENSISQNTCPAIALWVNDTSQTPSPNAEFQEVALHDGKDLVFASIINDDNTGFDNTTTYDFQAIVAENASSSGTKYYFYLELGS